MHHMSSSVHSTPYPSHSFSHLNVLACLILVTFSYRFFFYSLEILSINLGLFLVSLPSICALLTSGLSLILFTIPLLLTYLILIKLMSFLLLKLGFPLTLGLYTSAQLFDAISRGFTIIITSRPVPDACTSSIIGGGTAFLLREPCKLLSTPTATFKSFELSSVAIKLFHSNLALYNIYRPPQSTTKSRHSVSFSLETSKLSFSSVSTTPHEFLIIGNFNIHVDDLVDSNAIQPLLLPDHANLTQHVLFPTNRHSHTLVITSATLSPTVISLPISPSDHFPIMFIENY